jgi:CheY-like chemotaxis protein
MNHHLRILLIEDNPDGRNTLSALLGLLNHQVETAADGVERVEKALGWQPDVAVVDIGLPGLDGPQVARRLRAALGRRVFLIAHTGYGSPEIRRNVFASGFDVYLVKPLNFEDLLYWLSRFALEKKDRQQEEPQNRQAMALTPGHLF